MTLKCAVHFQHRYNLNNIYNLNFMQQIKIIWIGILLLSLSAQAQHDTINLQQLADSMQYSNNPGRAWLDLLAPIDHISLGDTSENGFSNELRRSYGFWRDRLPTGEGVLDPIGVYANSLISASNTSAPCTPIAGMFNGNWKNIGPQHASHPTDPTWLNNGQYSGRVYDTWTHPSNSDFILAGAVGGLWKTIDGGRNWSCLTDGILSNGSIGVTNIAVNPWNFNEIYIGTNITQRYELVNSTYGYGQGIWKTIDGGSTWTQESFPSPITLNSTFQNIIFCPHQVNTNQTMLLASSQNRLYQKIGSGSWQLITAAVGNSGCKVFDIVFTEAAYGKFYLANRHQPAPFLNGTGIYEYTYNSGTGIINTSYSTIADPNFVGGAGLDFGFFADVYTPTSSCSTTVNMAVNSEMMEYRIAYAGGGKLYALALSRSGDGGNIINPFPTCSINNSVVSPGAQRYNLMEYEVPTSTWNMVPLMKNVPIPPGTSDKCLEMAVHPNNPDLVYFGHVHMSKIYKNSLGVWTYAGIGNSGSHVDNRRMRIYTSQQSINNTGINDIVYVGTDGGISKMTSNVLKSINGLGLYLTQTYDLDVSKIGRRMGVAHFDNGKSFSTQSGIWGNLADGDGYNYLYNKLGSLTLPQYIFSNQVYWLTGLHQNTSQSNGLYAGPTGQNEPHRSYNYPFDFTNTDFYMGNKNAWIRLSASPWWQMQTNSGAFLSTGTTSICRSLKIAPSNPNIQYYGALNTAASQNVFYVKDVNSSNVYTWHNRTSGLTAVNSLGMRLTDVEVDSKNENRVFVCFGGVNTAGAGINRVNFSNDRG